MLGLILALLLSVTAPDMILKGGAILKEDRGFEVVRTTHVPLYVGDKAEPEVRVKVRVPQGKTMWVCLVSRAANDKPGGLSVMSGTNEAVLKYNGQAYHTRCVSLVAGWDVNHTLDIRSVGMDGRRDLIRRVTVG